ncbi:MAG: AMP-binding protein, partial [Acidimicrobiales bacterium]
LLPGPFASDDVVIVDGATRLTFAQLDCAVSAVARRFVADGIVPGSVIAMQLPNWWEAVVVSHAAFRIGAILNPLLPALRENELTLINAQAKPSAIVIPRGFRDVDYHALHASVTPTAPIVYLVRDVDPAASLDAALAGTDTTDALAATGLPPATWTADDPCLLLYTSGTSSAPKGAIHTHNALLAEVRGLSAAHVMSHDDVLLLPMPVTHIGGMVYGVLMPLVVGLRCVFLDVWDAARAIELLEEEAVTVEIGMPVFLRGMLDHPTFRVEAARTMRLFSMGGARVTPADVEEATARLGCWCKRSYGLTELPTLTTGPADDVTHRATTDGRPIGPSRIRIVDENHRDVPAGASGEIICQAPELFAGYLDAALNDDAFTDDGWFRTGDLGILDAEGFLSVTGRLKDIIIRGGENISPKEVEDLLVTHPWVHDVAIVAMPDRMFGERSCAFVQTEAPLTLDQVVAFLREHHVAPYKLPERLELRTDLPRNTTGKLRKDLMRAEIAAIVEREGATVATQT